MKDKGAGALRAVCAELAPEIPELADEIAKASDPWDGLVERLLSAGLLAEVDWKEWPEEVMAQLDRVIARRELTAQRWDWYDVDAFANRPLSRFLKAAGGALARDGLALVQLDIGGDSHPLAVLPERSAKAVLREAKTAGHRAIHWTGPPPKPPKQPAAKPERIALAPQGHTAEMGFGDILVLASDLGPKQLTQWVDATRWPPAIRKESRAAGWVARSRLGRWAAIYGDAIFTGDSPTRLATELACDSRPRYVAFVGERVVAFPWDEQAAPRLETRGKLVPAPGLSASDAGQQGSVAVGDEDFLVHGGVVWRLAKDRFVRASRASILEGRNFWDACPTERGFYYWGTTDRSGALYLVTVNGDAEKVKLGIKTDPWSVARVGPAGSILLAFHQPAAACFAALVFPQHGIAVPLPRKLLGNHTPGSSTHWLSAANRLVVSMGSFLLALPLDVLRALPQRTIKTGAAIPKTKLVRW